MHKIMLWACLIVLAPARAPAQTGPSGLKTEEGPVTLMTIGHRGGHPQAHREGLGTLLYETRRRTSIDIALKASEFVLRDGPARPSAGPPMSPLLVWQGDEAFDPLPQEALLPLSQALYSGGSLFVDASDGVASGPFEQSVIRELHKLLPNTPLLPVPQDHVLYKAFYLTNRHSGRTNARPYLLGMTLEGRLAVVVSSNDLMGAMAKDALGGWRYAVADGERAREMATRLVINWIMYALCLDYKSDQVHLPFILKRRR